MEDRRAGTDPTDGPRQMLSTGMARAIILNPTRTTGADPLEAVSRTKNTEDQQGRCGLGILPCLELNGRRFGTR